MTASPLKDVQRRRQYTLKICLRRFFPPRICGQWELIREGEAASVAETAAAQI